MPFIILIFLLLVAVFMSNVLRQVCAALVKLWNPNIGVVKDYNFQPTVSVLLPSFNEGKTVYDTVESICRSNYPNDKLEIIAIDDCSVDDSWEWLQKAQKDFTNIRIRVSRNPQNSGKARTICNALALSESEITIGIDSDCIFDKDCVRELVACFINPKIGAVGGVVGVKNVNQTTATAVQTFVYYQNFHMMKILENATQTVICISGCMFAIRRDLFVKLEPSVRERTWCGIEVNDGEDRFLTHQVLLHGYGTLINTAAQCWTTVPDTIPKLFKQQIRWQRSGVRDFFFTLGSLKEHVWKLHPNALYCMILPTLAVMASIAVMVLAPWHETPFWVTPYFLLLNIATAAIFNFFVKKYHPEQKVDHPILLATFAAWLIAGRLIEILAMFTLDSQDWGTRNKKKLTTGETHA